jgi:aminopeptidase N
MVIPLDMALLAANGREMAAQVLELNQEAQTYVFAGVDEKPVPSLLRGFSAPVRLDFAYSDAELAFLMAHDGDDFNRWEAGQRLMTKVLLRLVADVQAENELVLDEDLSTAFGHALHDKTLSARMKADLLTVPSEAWLADQMQAIDPQAIHDARRFLRRALAEAWEESLFAVYGAQQESGEYQVTPEAVGARRLKNLCLGLLMTLDNSAHHALATHQFRVANNMTDVLAALVSLAHTDCADRREVLQAFEQSWTHEPLVMDKWFSAQATSPLPGTLAEVRELMQHPAFNLTNPNKARSLIGGFARGNPLNFHAPDGSGYRFVAEQVLALDALNPQVASRMAGAFQQWRRFELHRRGLMQATLSELVARPSLSSELREVVERSLAD